jgi:SNF2 family DNA or RNA helicase
MEFASQASFLERMRDEDEIIWTFFRRDEKTHRWTVKPHARKAFFEFMASWSVCVRHPKRYGWRLDVPDVPEPVTIRHELDPTPAQVELRRRMILSPDGQMEIEPDEDRELNFIQAGKLSQIAKGFLYRREPVEGEEEPEEGGAYDQVDSAKPDFVADLVRSEVADGHRVILWTDYNAESNILAELLRARCLPFEIITGATKKKDRPGKLDRFRSGAVPILVCRASMLGYGLNLQFVTSMIFSGFNYSYESYYQALHRAFRHGQTASLRIHLPFVRGLESSILKALMRKQQQDAEAIAEMEDNYVRARQQLLARAG